MPPGGGGGGGGPEGNGSNGDDEARRNQAKLLGLAAAAVAVSAAFLFVPSANANEEGHRERMSLSEIAEWTIEHALFSVRTPRPRANMPTLARGYACWVLRHAAAGRVSLAPTAPHGCSCAGWRGPLGGAAPRGRTARSG